MAALLNKAGNRFKTRDDKFYKVDVQNPFLYLFMQILNVFICSKKVIFKSRRTCMGSQQKCLKTKRDTTKITTLYHI